MLPECHAKEGDSPVNYAFYSQTHLLHFFVFLYCVRGSRSYSKGLTQAYSFGNRLHKTIGLSPCPLIRLHNIKAAAWISVAQLKEKVLYGGTTLHA